MLGGNEERVLVFLPTLNDTNELERLILGVNRLGERYQPLVIDDGSVPLIDARALPPKTLVANLPGNYGLGLCTHVAFDHAQRRGYGGGVVRIDADGQHPPDFVPLLMEQLDSGEADVVVGRRLNHGEGAGLRHLSSILAKSYIRLLTRLLVGRGAPEDVNSGLMAFNARAIEVLNRCHLERYPEPQVICLSLLFGLRVKSVDVRQEVRSAGDSTIGVIQGLQIMYRFTIFVLGEALQRRPRT